MEVIKDVNVGEKLAADLSIWNVETSMPFSPDKDKDKEILEAFDKRRMSEIFQEQLGKARKGPVKEHVVASGNNTENLLDRLFRGFNKDRDVVTKTESKTESKTGAKNDLKQTTIFRPELEAVVETKESKELAEALRKSQERLDFILDREFKLKFTDDPVKICMDAVRRDWRILEYVKKYQTESMCLVGVKQCGFALKFVELQTDKVCEAAVRRTGKSLFYVARKTRKMCKLAVKQDVYALQFVDKEMQTPRMCFEAVRKNPYVLQFVRRQTERVCLEAVRGDPYVIFYVEKQFRDLCMLAISMDGGVLRVIWQPTLEMKMAAVRNDGLALQFVDGEYQTPEMCLAAVEQNGLALQFVENQQHIGTICRAAVEQNGMALEFVKNKTLRICIAAVSNTVYAKKFVPDQFQSE